MKKLIRLIIVILIVGLIIFAIYTVLQNGTNESRENNVPDNREEKQQNNEEHNDNLENLNSVISKNPELSELNRSLSKAELADDLNDTNKKFTVFAPINEAFSGIDEEINLSDLLQNHVVEQEINIENLENGQTVNTLNGKTLTIEINNGEIFINYEDLKAKVLVPQIETSNGVIYIINEVLVSK